MSETAPKRVGVFLARLSAFHLNSPCDARRLSECVEAWRACVGEPLSAHVAPVFYAGGRLTLHVDSSLWSHKLLHQRATLIRQMRQLPAFRDLIDLQIRVVPRGMRRAAQKPASPIGPSDYARSVIARSAADISDPALRAALTNLAGNRTKTR